MSTNFIHSIQDAVSNSEVEVSKEEFEKFVLFVLTESENFSSIDAYYNALVYTKVELSVLASGHEKKTE